jgi:hypothetical protein
LENWTRVVRAQNAIFCAKSAPASNSFYRQASAGARAMGKGGAWCRAASDTIIFRA